MSAGTHPAKLGALTPWALPLGIIVTWEALSVAGLIPGRVLPAPTDVVAAGWKLLRSGELLRNVWVSFWRAIVGFAIGGGIGFAFGLANGLSRRSEQVFDSTLQMVRNIPHLALIPLVILWFGIDEEAKVFLVALGVFFPIYINTQHGIRSVPAGRSALDLRRAALCARYHVAHAHCRRDHRGLVRYRLHGDAGARVPAGGCRRTQHRDLRAVRKARRQLGAPA